LKRSKGWGMKWWVVGITAFGTTVVGAAPEASEPLTVLAMIKTESDVLAKWQAKQNEVAARARPAPSLLGIYGVGLQLRATVLVNGREVVFEQGRPRPVMPQVSSLRLRYIKPPCVSFAQGAQRQTLCLSRVGS